MELRGHGLGAVEMERRGGWLGEDVDRVAVKLAGGRDAGAGWEGGLHHTMMVGWRGAMVASHWAHGLLDWRWHRGGILKGGKGSG
jgi:hypothetical protein